MYTCTYSVNPTETCMPCKTCMYALQNLHDGFWDDGFWNVIKDGEPKALRRSLSPPRSASHRTAPLRQEQGKREPRQYI